jgi:hypothetical protein
VADADAHHQQLRFTWGLRPAGEERVVVGFDVVDSTTKVGSATCAASSTGSPAAAHPNVARPGFRARNARERWLATASVDMQLLGSVFLQVG